MYHIICTHHAHPSKGGDTLADRRQMIEERRHTVLLAVLRDGCDLLRGGLKQLLLARIVRLG